MINAFLDWAQEQQDVWIVSNEQLLAWVRNPVSVSELDSFSPLKCSTPQVDSSKQICNGIPQNEDGLLELCDFSDFPFYTCYGCPQETPTPDDPNPPQATQSGQQLRFRLPANCSTPFWDPIGNECICQSGSCEFADDSRPVGPNGANLTGGGTGGAFNSSTASAVPSFVTFNDGGVLPQLPSGLVPALAVSFVGAMLGALGVYGRL